MVKINVLGGKTLTTITNISKTIGILTVGLKELSTVSFKDTFSDLIIGLKTATKEGLSLMDVLTHKKLKSKVTGLPVDGLGMSAQSATALTTAATAGIALAVGAAVVALQHFSAENEKYIDGINKKIQASTESISKSNDEIDALKSLGKSLEDAKGNKEKLWAISNDLNDTIGKTPGLLEGEADAWEIANQKIKDRIALLEKEVEAETTSKVNSQKELFANKHVQKSVLGIDFLAADERGDYMRSIAQLVQNAVNDGKTIEEAYKNVGTMISSMGSSFNLSLDEFKTYFNENTALAQDIFSALVQQADTGISGKAFLNEFIEKSVYSGKELPEIETELKAFIADVENVNSIVDKYYETVQKGENADSILTQIQDAFQDMATKYAFAADIIINKSNNVAEQIVNAFKNPVDNIDNVSISIQEAYNNFAKLHKEFESGAIKSDDYTKSLTDQLTEIKAIIDANPQMAKGYQYIADILKTSIATAPTTLEDLRKATVSVIDSAYTLSDAFKEQSENGGLSLSTTLKLIDLGYAAAISINAETGAVTINTQAYLQLAQAKIEEQIVSLKLNRDTLITKLENEKTAVDDLAKAYYYVGEEAINAALKQVKARQTKTEADLKSKDVEIASLEALKKDLSKVPTGNYKPYSSSSSKNNSTSSSAKEKEVYKVEIESVKLLEIELQKVNELLSQNDKLFNTSEGNKDKQASLLQERIKLLKEQQSLLHEINQKNRGSISGNIQELSKFGIKVEYTPEINKLEFTQSAEEIQSIINKIKVGDVENSNKVKKELESIFDLTIKINEDNYKNSSQWLDIASSIKETSHNLSNIDYSYFLYDANKNIENLDLQLKLVSESDYDKKLEIVNQQLSKQQSIVARTELEIQKYKNALDDGSISIETYNQKVSELNNQLLSSQYDVNLSREDIVKQLSDQFDSANKVLDKKLNKIDFKISITSDSKAEEHEHLINRKIENRLALSQNLLNQMVKLRLETDNNVKSTQAYENLMNELESTYDDNIKAIYDLVDAQKSLAESQISSVKDLQDKIIDVLKERYQKEEELLKDNYDLKKKQIDDEKDLLKRRYDSEVKNIEDTLKAYKKQWEEEDKRKKKQQDDDDINEIQRKINELKLAASTGDAEAISRIEDLQKKYSEKLKKINEEEEDNRRDSIKDDLDNNKDALKEKYDMDIQSLEDRQELLEDEYDADKKLLEEKLKNANLYAEARIIIEKGVNAELNNMLREYEDEFGEGMGILGDYVKTKLTQQILDAGIALNNLSQHIKIATDTDMFEKVLNGENVVNTNLSRLTNDKISVIEQMKQNSIAWAEATTEADKVRLKAENERLAIAYGWFKDTETGIWYLDDTKTQKLFDVISKFETTQTSSFDTLVKKYEEDYTKFGEFQNKKLLAVKTLNDGIVESSSGMTDTLYENISKFGDDVGVVITQIGNSVNQLMSKLTTIDNISINTQNKSKSITVAGMDMDTIGFASGGLNKEAGLRFLHPEEQVLTAEQTKAFSELVFGLKSEGMKNIADNIKKGYTPNVPNMPNATNVQNRNLIDANFNFNGGVTQEAMPQIKRLMNDAIYELKSEIPTIVANQQRESIRRIGGR